MWMFPGYFVGSHKVSGFQNINLTELDQYGRYSNVGDGLDQFLYGTEGVASAVNVAADAGISLGVSRFMAAGRYGRSAGVGTYYARAHGDFGNPDWTVSALTGGQMRVAKTLSRELLASPTSGTTFSRAAALELRMNRVDRFRFDDTFPNRGAYPQGSGDVRVGAHLVHEALLLDDFRPVASNTVHEMSHWWDDLGPGRVPRLTERRAEFRAFARQLEFELSNNMNTELTRAWKSRLGGNFSAVGELIERRYDHIRIDYFDCLIWIDVF